jgi:hypothetical protein
LTIDQRSRVQKGIDLEDAVTVWLQAMKTDGHVIQDYRLLSSASYPDFYVKDSKGREWLLECKNIFERRPLSKWWFAHNVFNKRWNERVYRIAESYLSKYDGVVRRITPCISIRNVTYKALVISHDWWDDEARAEVNTFFGDNVVVFGEQLRLGSPAYEELFFKLRDLFLR